VVVAVAIVNVMQAPIYEVINMISMRDSFMATVWAVNMITA
jgi:hypothetical protein